MPELGTFRGRLFGVGVEAVLGATVGRAVRWGGWRGGWLGGGCHLDCLKNVLAGTWEEHPEWGGARGSGCIYGGVALA